MVFLRTLLDHERWHWFAAGETAGKVYPRPAGAENESERVLFEIGLLFAVPLAFAALISIILGA